MRHTYKFLLLAGMGAMVTMSSCRRELLTPIPQTTISDASSFSTPSRVQGQLLSLYGAMKNGQFYGGRVVIDGDIKGEDFINQTSNLITGSDVWALNPTNSATAVVNLWGQVYADINDINVFLDGMSTTGTTVVGATVAANYIGEAKFLRAVCYYSLLQLYARPYADGNGSKLGVPLRLTAIKSPGASDLVRSSVADVYTQILKDLNEAETSLPLTNSSAYNNTTRAHRNTAIAFKTRVYLSMQQYANVITEANKIVSASAPFSATTGVANALVPNIATVFSTYTTAENIFSMPNTNTAGDYPGTQNQLGYYYSPPASLGGVGNGEFSLNDVNGIVVDPSWTATDARRTNFILKTGTGATAKTWLTKYKVGGNYLDYVPVMRYSEVLLNLAEAKARTIATVDPQAVALLNAVRNRSDAATMYTVASFATTTDLTNAILKERRIEFLGEGLRNNDLMRLLQTIPAKGTAQAKMPGDVGYIWPIPSGELALNKLAVDN